MAVSAEAAAKGVVLEGVAELGLASAAVGGWKIFDTWPGSSPPNEELSLGSMYIGVAVAPWST